MEEEKHKALKKGGPVYIFTPNGSIKEITDKADLLMSLMEQYKVDSSLINEVLQEEIDELKKELIDEMEKD